MPFMTDLWSCSRAILIARAQPRGAKFDASCDRPRRACRRLRVGGVSHATRRCIFRAQARSVHPCVPGEYRHRQHLSRSRPASRENHRDGPLRPPTLLRHSGARERASCWSAEGPQTDGGYIAHQLLNVAIARRFMLPQASYRGRREYAPLQRFSAPRGRGW
jgi:hypothetical protein